MRERRRDVSGARDGIASGAEMRERQKGKNSDGERHQRRSDGRCDANCAAGDHLMETGARFRMRSGESGHILKSEKN